MLVFVVVSSHRRIRAGDNSSAVRAVRWIGHQAKSIMKDGLAERVRQVNEGPEHRVDDSRAVACDV